MTTRLWLWLVPGVLYAGFCFWYTNTGGALSDDEITMFVQQMERTGRGPQEIVNMRRFMEEDTGRQFLMVNIMDMADTPRPVEGASPDESSGQVMGRNMPRYRITLSRYLPVVDCQYHPYALDT